jgi:sulfur carrier protein ThiS
MKGALVVDPDGGAPEEGSIRVHFWRDERVEVVDEVPGESMMDLLKRLGVRIDGALVMRKGSPVPLDDPVLTKDVLTVIDVQSGG